MNKKLALAAAMTFAAAAPAEAELLIFTLTGDYDATFQLDQNPTPDLVGEGLGFDLYDISGTFPGSTNNIADLTFFNSLLGGGFSIYDGTSGVNLVSTLGQQLYTGSESAPTLLTGTYSLGDFGDGSYTLVIAAAQAPAVPEPASWAMMIAGFGLVGGTLRRAKAEVAYAA